MQWRSRGIGYSRLPHGGKDVVIVTECWNRYHHWATRTIGRILLVASGDNNIVFGDNGYIKAAISVPIRLAVFNHVRAR
jgi:hypothetical protein